MANELKSYQSQVNAYKFEIERLDKCIGDTKSDYFENKRQEMRQMMLQQEVIPEEQYEEGGMDMDGSQGLIDVNNNLIHNHAQPMDNHH